jgi:hypothetical protein
MRESQLWTLVKANLPGHLIRIENLAGNGQPDVNGCHNTAEAWIELKVAKGNYLFFRTSQLAFFQKRHVEGGRVFVLARVGDMIHVFPAAHLLQVLDQVEAVKGQEGKACKIKWEIIPGVRVFGKPYKWDFIADIIYAL